MSRPEKKAAEKPRDFTRSAARLLRVMGSDGLLVAGCLLVGAVSVALGVSVPKSLGSVTDQIVRGARTPSGVDFGQVARALTVVACVVAVAALCALVRGRLAQTLAQRTAHRLREQAADKLSRLPLGHFDRQPRGEVLSRLTNDIDNVATTLQQALTRVIASLLIIVGVLVMMVSLSPLLTSLAVLTLPVAALVTRAFARRAQPQFVRQWDATGRLNAHVEEMYTGHTLVKVHGRGPEALRTFDEHNAEVCASSHRAQFLSGVIEPVTAFIGHLTYVLIAVVGGLRVAAGAMTIGDIQAFITYTLQFNNPVTQMASLTNVVQSGIASAERVFALLDAEEQQPDPAAPQRPARLTGKVEFQAVSFRYEPAKPLIEDLSLTVEPHHTLAVVGPTGAGKTTLVNLLLRFYETTGGRILLDGTDIAAMSRAELRGHIGMVLQDTWLFGGTIAENIGYGLPGASHEEIVGAARAAHADGFIRTLPEGYGTVLGEDGGGLSAGEKQLLTIARAFLSRPAVLVLDEATSSVDTRTEMLIQQGMTALREGRTSFVIAHRLSTIRDADTILVMEAGRIVEHGTHTGLLAARGAYARLHAAQFAEPASA